MKKPLQKILSFIETIFLLYFFLVLPVLCVVSLFLPDKEPEAVVESTISSSTVNHSNIVGNGDSTASRSQNSSSSSSGSYSAAYQAGMDAGAAAAESHSSNGAGNTSNRSSTGIRSNSTTYRTTPRPGYDLEMTVYVSQSGGKIHKRSNCSGMKYYYTMTYAEACEHGYSHCQKCF